MFVLKCVAVKIRLVKISSTLGNISYHISPPKKVIEYPINILRIYKIYIIYPISLDLRTCVRKNFFWKDGVIFSLGHNIFHPPWHLAPTDKPLSIINSDLITLKCIFFYNLRQLAKFSPSAPPTRSQNITTSKSELLYLIEPDHPT